MSRQAAEIGAILENEKRGRVGLEVGYTGRQALEFDPYRTVSPGFVELNALGEPITDVWAPLDGRTFNLGIRAEL